MRNSTWKAVTASFAAVALIVSLGISSPVLARGGGGGGGGHGGGGFGGGHAFSSGGFRAGGGFGGGHAFAGGGFHEGGRFHAGRDHRFHGNGGFDNYNACAVSPFFLFGNPYSYSC